MGKIDFKDLAQLCLHHARTLVPDIAPGGKMIGREYTCATVQGGQGMSCKINMETGLWLDGATDEKGGDLISLYAAANGVSQIEAAKQLAEKLHYKIPDGTERKKLPSPKPVTKSEKSMEQQYQLGPIPDTVQEPNFFHIQFGPASKVWCYYGMGGERLMWTARYDTKDGKQFVPYSWCEIRHAIVAKAWPENRPLYGLELLAQYPDRMVIITEGEKAADAIKKFNQTHYIPITWSGGAKAWAKTDWTPLHGRKVLIWPDNDRKIAKKQIDADKYGVALGEVLPLEGQPGMQAAQGIAKLLSSHCEVKIFSMHTVPLVGDIDGFDAADAVEMGWTWKQLAETIRPLVVKVEPPPPEPVPEPFKDENPSEWVSGSVYDLYIQAKLECDLKMKPYCNMANVALMIDYHPLLKGKIWFDEFLLKMMTNWRTSVPVEWQDMDDLALCMVFQTYFKMPKMNESTVHAGVRLYADQHRRNTARDFLENGPEWDGTTRIREFFIRAFGASNTLYTRQASQNFWLAMVYRIMEPGIKFDHMVILEGKQGAKKSSALEAIAGDWFGEAHEDLKNKDFQLCLQGKLIIEFPELSAFTNSEVELIKKIITIRRDRWRVHFGRAMTSFGRTSVFVGTTNRDDYLHDETGNRRFWPVKVNEIDLDYIKENRVQLFSEAFARYKERIEYWIMPKEETEREQEARRNSDVYEQIIKEWLTGQMHDQEKIDPMDIYKQLGIDTDRLDKRMQNRVGKAMRAIGWEYVPAWIGQVQKKVWRKKTPHPSSKYN